MPGFDGTGPRGLGPMTGGARGFCAMPAGNVGAGYHRDYAYRGYGPFNRPVYGTPSGSAYQAPSSQRELDQLRNDFNQLLNELEELEARIDRLEKR